MVDDQVCYAPWKYKICAIQGYWNSVLLYNLSVHKKLDCFLLCYAHFNLNCSDEFNKDN